MITIMMMIGVKITDEYIPLISRVFGPYCKLWTEFF